MDGKYSLPSDAVPEEANQRQESCCYFDLCFFFPVFPLLLCFLFYCDDCLLLNRRFSVQSAPKSHQQTKSWWHPLIFSVID